MLSKITTKDALEDWRTKINLLIDAVEALRVTSNAGTTGQIGGSVTSVSGKTGAVNLFAEDILGLGTAATASSGSFASYIQGLRADSALQLANADQRYIRSINGNTADGSGNVSVQLVPEYIDSGTFEVPPGDLPQQLDSGTFGTPPDGAEGGVGPTQLDSGTFGTPPDGSLPADQYMIDNGIF